MLIAATAAWTPVVHAVVEELERSLRCWRAKGPQLRPCRPLHSVGCASDAELRRHLDLVCAHELHGLLLQWLCSRGGGRGREGSLRSPVASSTCKKYANEGRKKQICADTTGSQEIPEDS